jgi:hypothetical protein
MRAEHDVRDNVRWRPQLPDFTARISPQLLYEDGERKSSDKNESSSLCGCSDSDLSLRLTSP